MLVVSMIANTEPTYGTGEPIREGDSVRVGRQDGVVECIITKESDGWADYWRDATGEGVMLVGPAFGRMFTKFHDEDLVFVARKQGL